MTPWLYDLLMIFIAGLLVLINGFFVAAELALVKIRESRVEELIWCRQTHKTLDWEVASHATLYQEVVKKSRPVAGKYGPYRRKKKLMR